MRFFRDAVIEMRRARRKYPECPSIEHALYVLKREMAEVEEVVRSGSGKWDLEHMYEEVVQVAAMAGRLATEALHNAREKEGCACRGDGT